MPLFSDYAREKLIDLYSNHAHQVGSKLQAKDSRYKDFEATDCITYVKQVLVHAYRSSGRQDFAAKILKNLRNNDGLGTPLAKFLVEEDGWKGVYINPNTYETLPEKVNPQWNAWDVRRTRKYYGIPLSYQVVNYMPERWKVDVPVPAKFQFMMEYVHLTTVGFGFGCSHGGWHTWLFSYGEAYEAHEENSPTDNLYEKRLLSQFTKRWLTGAMVIPPDAFQRSLAGSTTALSCP